MARKLADTDRKERGVGDEVATLMAAAVTAAILRANITAEKMDRESELIVAHQAEIDTPQIVRVTAG